LGLVSKLGFKLGLVVIVAIAILTVFLTSMFTSRLTTAYREAGQSQLEGIAATLANRFTTAHRHDPERLQSRITRLRDDIETLHKISVSWHGRDGSTYLVQSGHIHDPDGAKRDVQTSKVEPAIAGAPAAPIDAPRLGYREVSGADGVHYGELNKLIRRNGRTLAALELHYDLKGLDEALARNRRTVVAVAVLAAITLMLVLNLLLSRTVVLPLSKLRAATKRIGSGETDTRLSWRRADEIGSLARDFDTMAEELHAVHGHLEALALKDPLTGLLNHRAYQERLLQELRRAEREGYAVSIVALDVDRFKQVNDRFGHAAGDEALRALTRAIRAELRPSDIAGRLGGDEFMLAIVRGDIDAAEIVVDRLRTRIAEMPLGPTGEPLTISAGIAGFPRHSLSQEELMHLADGAMYWAKSSGRDCIRVYSAETDYALSPEQAADRAAREGLVNTVHALAKAVDAKDGYTHSHSQRVARCAARLAESLGMDSEAVERVRTAGVLHDVGKIGISDLLLLKPERLTEEEFEEMRRHSELGRDIIAGAGMHQIADAVLHLHERFDGGGYPSGLSGETIPLESRVLNVADAFEAMTSSRVYREAGPVELAVGELEEGAGGQFDPWVVEHMVGLVRAGEIVVEADEATLQSVALDVVLPIRPHLNGSASEHNTIPQLNGSADLEPTAVASASVKG